MASVFEAGMSEASYYRIVSDEGKDPIGDEVRQIVSLNPKVMPASLVVPSLKNRTYMDLTDGEGRWRGRSGWKIGIECPALFHATGAIFSYALLQGVSLEVPSEIPNILRRKIMEARQVAVLGEIKDSLQDVFQQLDGTSLTEHGLTPMPSHIKAVVVSGTISGGRQALAMQECFKSATGTDLPFIRYDREAGKETIITKEELLSSLSEKAAFEKAKRMIPFGGKIIHDQGGGILVSQMTESEVVKLSKFLGANTIDFDSTIDNQITIKQKPTDFVETMEKILAANSASMAQSLKVLYRTQSPIEFRLNPAGRLKDSEVQFGLGRADQERVLDISRVMSIKGQIGVVTNTRNLLGFDAYSMIYKFADFHKQLQASFPRVFRQSQRSSEIGIFQIE